MCRALTLLHSPRFRLPRRLHPCSLDAPLLGWRPHRLDNGDWSSIYLGDPAVLPSELVDAAIVVQSRNGQSWTVAAVRSSSPIPGDLRNLDFRLLPG